MESKVQKQEQQMPIYGEQSGGGFQEEDFNTEVEDENCVPQMSGNEEERMEDLEVKTILTSKLHMMDNSLKDNLQKQGIGGSY